MKQIAKNIMMIAGVMLTGLCGIIIVCENDYLIINGKKHALNGRKILISGIYYKERKVETNELELKAVGFAYKGQASLIEAAKKQILVGDDLDKLTK